MLGRVCKYISKSTANTLFKSLLLPVLEYGDIIYGTANVISLDKIQKIQNSGMRIILMAPKHMHIKDMLSEFNFLSMETQRYFHLATLVSSVSPI